MECAQGQTRARPNRVQRKEAEEDAKMIANANYRALFGTQGPLYPVYSHAIHGNPDCI